MDFCEFVAPTEAEQQMRDVAVQRVSAVVKSIWPSCQVSYQIAVCLQNVPFRVTEYQQLHRSWRCVSMDTVMIVDVTIAIERVNSWLLTHLMVQVKVFGSFATGLYLPTSDVDVCSFSAFYLSINLAVYKQTLVYMWVLSSEFFK